MKKVTLKIILMSLFLHSTFAGLTTLSLGSIERNSGGRVYSIGLTSSEIKNISLYSSSENPEANIKLFSVIYYNGIFPVELLASDNYTSAYPSDLSIDISDLARFPVITEYPNCTGPCLIVHGEAFGANDLKLNVQIEALFSDIKVWSTGVTGLTAYSRENSESSQGNSRMIHLRDYSLSYEVVGVNADGSRVFTNFLVHLGENTFRLSNFSSPNLHKLCVLLGSDVGIDFTRSVDRNIVDRTNLAEREEFAAIIYELSSGAIDTIWVRSGRPMTIIDRVSCKI